MGGGLNTGSSVSNPSQRAIAAIKICKIDACMSKANMVLKGGIFYEDWRFCIRAFAVIL